jgi:GntP family gluconate:H+ symporter
MTPLYLLLVGLVIVIGSILVLRLHPIIALLLGALAVSFLTPDELLRQFALSSHYSPEATQSLTNQTPGARIAMAQNRFPG